MASDGEVVAEGEWHPPHSSRAVPAELREKGGCVVATENTVLLAAAVPETIEVSLRVGSIPRRIGFPDGSVFETHDNDGIDRYLRARRYLRGGLVHHLERFQPRLIFLVLSAIALIGVIYRLALPLLVEVAVLVTPPVVPQMIGSSALVSLDRTLLSPSGLPQAERDAIAKKFTRLAAQASGGSAAYNLNFRDGGAIGPNAFALPDGSLVITDALVELADGDTEMVLGVLGHEIAHVEFEHSLRQVYRVAGITGLVMLIAGDVGAGVEDILTHGGALVALSFSRSAEAEADRRSVELMSAAGYDPAALARFFALLEREFSDHAETSLLSSHPGTPERQQEIRAYANEIRAQNPR